MATSVPLTDSHPKATNVVEALARVIRDLPGIGKDERAAAQQGGYAYRGIEAITRAVQPLLAREGIVFVPSVTSCEVREIVVAGKPWTDTILHVDYLIAGPGDSLRASVVGIGRDNSDKGANKAMTQAFKYALLQVLCIADGADDGDQASYAADTAEPPRGRRKTKPPARAPDPELPPENSLPPGVDPDVIGEVIDTIDALTDDQKETFHAWKAAQGFPWPWPSEACAAMMLEIARILSAETQPA